MFCPGLTVVVRCDIRVILSVGNIMYVVLQQSFTRPNIMDGDTNPQREAMMWIKPANMESFSLSLSGWSLAEPFTINLWLSGECVVINHLAPARCSHS